jgi:hypothetical protein
VKLPDGWSRAQPLFDDESLVSYAGLVPVMALAQQAGLSELISGRVAIGATRVKSAGANPAGKLTSIIAGMAAGADSIDDLDLIRSGGMPRLFAEVYASATLGQFLREFTHGHALQLASVARGAPGEPGPADRAAARDRHPGVCGHRFAAAPGLRARQAGRQLRAHQDLRPAGAAAGPVPTGHHDQHRARRAGGGRDPAARREGRLRQGRGVDGARGDRHRPCRRGDRRDPGAWGLGLRHQRGRRRRCEGRGAVLRRVGQEPGGERRDRRHRRRRVDAGALPGRGPRPGHRAADLRRRVAEVEFTAFTSTARPVTARLVVRRVRDRAKADELFPVWRHHRFLTNSTEPTAQADITHRRHAVIETVFADLIDGPLAHLPSGRFAANSAWAICAAITHNLLRAAGALSSPTHALARGATLRRQIVTVPPGWPDRSAAESCTCPRTGAGPSNGPPSG